MTSKFLDETNSEFNEFMQETPIQPPQKLKFAVLDEIYKDLNPNPWKVFSKLSLIHFLASGITLSLCPQFGLEIYGDGMWLMDYFQSFGHYGCAAACGAFFVSFTLVCALIFLKKQEVKVLRKRRLLQVSGLSFLSMGAFIMADAEIIFGFGLAWILGSIIGGIALLEIGNLFKLVLRPVRH